MFGMFLCILLQYFDFKAISGKKQLIKSLTVILGITSESISLTFMSTYELVYVFSHFQSPVFSFVNIGIIIFAIATSQDCCHKLLNVLIYKK